MSLGLLVAMVPNMSKVYLANLNCNYSLLFMYLYVCMYSTCLKGQNLRICSRDYKRKSDSQL